MKVDLKKNARKRFFSRFLKDYLLEKK
ncbi:MAG: hypothetical protein XE03_1472, partial [candidate division TA06 bacterium 34_109]